MQRAAGLEEGGHRPRRGARAATSSRRRSRLRRSRATSAARCCRASTSCTCATTGVAFGVLSGGGGAGRRGGRPRPARPRLYFAAHADRPLVWLPTGLLVGGALGNLVDRARDGAVTDFIKLPLWPAFNLADVAITVGVLALVLRHRGCTGAGWRSSVGPEAAGTRARRVPGRAARVALRARSG